MLALVGLVCLAVTAGILTGFGAVRGMIAFFFASAVCFFIEVHSALEGDTAKRSEGCCKGTNDGDALRPHRRCRRCNY
jgi:hypothetical protein